MITLRYTINGCKFRRRYPRQQYRVAAAMAGILRDNGIAVKVRGMPTRDMRITVRVPR